jgi:hypothetical protein
MEEESYNFCGRTGFHLCFIIKGRNTLKGIFFCIGLALLIGYGCAAAPPKAENLSAKILDYGIYNEEVREIIKDESVPGGTRGSARYSLIEETNKIPAKLGISFGFRYKLYGVPEKSKLKFKRLFFFPKQGLTDKGKGRTYYKAQLDDELIVRETMEIGYKFEHPWELVPGKWSFQVWYEGKKLAEKTFTVYSGARP